MSKHTTRRYPGKTLEEKFWLYTSVGAFTDCWIWHGPNDSRQGYGVLYITRHKRIYAHRLSYQLHYGPFDSDLDVCHTCDTPACVNPYHLWLGTHKDNMDDMIAKGHLVIPRLKGEKSPLAKLTETAVVEIRRLYAEGLTQREIASQFGVKRQCISRIVLRQRWNHIP